MSPSKLEVLDYVETELGTLILRRRDSPSLGPGVYEVTLAGEFLMSSAVNATELALADLAMARCSGKELEVCVGGLGLGCTAARVLDDARVRRLVVVELLQPVLRWHEHGIVPLGQRLCDDDRCAFVQQDFFAWAAATPSAFDAILIDIDHSPAGAGPESLLHPHNADFWAGRGPEALAAKLRQGGILALWSADPPTPDFVARFRRSFDRVAVEEIEFAVPQLDRTDRNSILLASR